MAISSVDSKASKAKVKELQGAGSKKTARTSDSTGTKPKQSDVFLRDSALSFEAGDQEPSPERQLDRAARFLEVLRDKPNGKGNFGGKLTGSGIDAAASLRHYYPVLNIARQLARDDKLAPGVHAFLPQLSLPADLAELAAGAVGLSPEGLSGTATTTPSARAEQKAGDLLPSKPLGNRSLGLTELEKLINACDPRVFELTDACLERVSEKLDFDRLLCVETRKPSWHAALARALDRAIVLDIEKDPVPMILHYVSNYFPGKLLEDRETAMALAGLLKRVKLNPDQLECGEWVRLSRNAKFQRIWDDYERVCLGALAQIPIRRPVLEMEAAPLAPEPTKDDDSTYNAWCKLFRESDPRYFDAPDSCVADLTSRDIGPEYFLGEIPHPGALRLMARVFEISYTTFAEDKTKKWLSAGIPPEFTGDEYILPLARLVKACDVDPRQVMLTLGDGIVIPLAAHPKLLRRVPPPPGLAAELAGAFSAFDPAVRAPSGAKVAALERFVAKDNPIEFSEVMQKARRGILDGKLEPIDFRALSSDEQARVIKALASDKHIGIAVAWASVFVHGAEKELAAVFGEIGLDRAMVAQWVGHASALASLDPKTRAFALADLSGPGAPDFLLLPLRIELAALKTLDEKSLGALFDEHQALDPSGVARALIDRAALSPGSAEQEAVSTVLRSKVGDKSLSTDDVRAAFRGGGYALVLPEVDQELDAAVQGVLRSDLLTREAAVTRLAETIKGHAAFVDTKDLTAAALAKLYQSDLATVMPLGQADQELGGVAAKAWSAQAGEEPGGVAAKSRSKQSDKSPSGKRVTVAGIEIPVNDDPRKDASAVPRKSDADLVMTDTTARNLRLMAAEWRRARPVLLEGPTSAGKTSMVKYMAYMTGSPFRRLNLSYHTEVDDLIGRYVGGENKYSKADLEKMTPQAIEVLAEEYGLEQGLARAKQIELLLDAQHKPRWVDGLLVKAMRKGEVLVLDEINLARPEVLERLNSLFDDDGNIVLTEHRNEIIVPHKNFRAYATMNPASYSGRARLSEAQRSRWTSLYCQGLNRADLTKILKTKYGDAIPARELAKLIAAHDALARAADDGTMGKASGGMAFSLRNLFRVCDRFQRYQGGELADDALMRRETEEIYRGGLFDPDDIQSVNDILLTAMPYSGPGFYENLEFKETGDILAVGDVSLRKLNTGHPLVPSDKSRLVLTRRTKEILYRLAKALDCGENVALIGERASGKTAMAKMYAHLLGQPYYRQQVSASTDTMQLIGGYDDKGWKDGLLLEAGRPENTPGTLVVDEFNLGSSALLERFNPVLDDDRKVVLGEKEGEEIRLHKDFRFVAAMNPPTKAYGGRQKLSKAMQNRLTTIYVPDLSKRGEQSEILTAIAKEKAIPIPAAEALVDLHQWAVLSYGNGALGKNLKELDRPVLSIRQLRSALDMVAEYQGELGPAGAFLLAVETYYASTSEDADCKAIMARAQEIAK